MDTSLYLQHMYNKSARGGNEGEVYRILFKFTTLQVYISRNNY